jgi:hypothetical protein
MQYLRHATPLLETQTTLSYPTHTYCVLRCVKQKREKETKKGTREGN